MSDTLLNVLQNSFATAIDPDSDSGKILGALQVTPPIIAQTPTEAQISSLAFVPTASGVSVRAAQAAQSIRRA